MSILLGYVLQSNNVGSSSAVYELVDTSNAIFPQEVVSVSKTPIEITKLYREGRLVGIVHDETRLDNLSEEVYISEYEAEFPDSKLGFIDDVYQTKELSYNVYEDRDEEIFQYLYDEDLFAIEANKVTFSNGAVIYVKNRNDFDAAREKFILNFISQDTYSRLKNEENLLPLLDYGTRDISFSVAENITFSKGLASKDEIMKSEAEILTFLSYGYDPEIETYVVQEYDTVAGIGYQYGMNTAQLTLLNPTIVDDNQILATGTELNVTNFNSPLTVTVVRERKTSEVVYAGDTIYKEDPTLREGSQIVETPEENGSRDVVYQETFVNGVNIESTEIASTVTKEPVREVIRVGTYVEPRIGSGNFRWPLNNSYVLCGFGCYAGHRGTDFSSYGNPYTAIYPIDRGVITTRGYDAGGWGYYVVINHNNGYTSLYAHMQSPSYFATGQTVTKNDVIGTVGMTGRTSYPHVHLEVRRNGGIINACTVLGC